MKRIEWVMSFGLVLLALCATSTYAESPREQLKAMVEQLQKTPSDDALREQIIKLAQTLKPAAAVPEEARRSFVEGNTITRSAKNAKEQLLAVESFNEALKIAPWWDDAYYNLAVAQELAEQLDDSEKSLKLYLLTNPPEKDAREAQDRIYALSAKSKLAKASAASEKKQQEQSFEGFWQSDFFSQDEPNIADVYRARKFGDASYQVDYLTRDNWTKITEVNVDERKIEWFQQATGCDSSPCGTRHRCRLVAAGELLCAINVEGQRIIPPNERRYMRRDRCESLGYKGSGGVKAWRCQ